MSTEHLDFSPDLWRKRQIIQVDGTWTVEGRPRTQYKILQVEKPSNIPGRVYVAVLVTVPPKAATPPHTHNGAAIYAQVINGRMISQMVHPNGEHEQDSGVNIYGPGEMWYEQPGCRHVRSENVSDEESAQFFANFIIEEDRLEGLDEASLLKGLTILDVDERSPYHESVKRDDE